MKISIHALLAESDYYNRPGLFFQYTFLSTLSLRRATELNSSWISSIRNFYPRSPCGERLMQEIAQQRKQRISIHALLAESDHPCKHLLII